MLNMPMIVFGYGDFMKDQKLFSYEKDGVAILPIFTDAEKAGLWQTQMNVLLKEHFGELRTLSLLVCSEADKAVEVLETVRLLGSVTNVLINPALPSEVMNDDDIEYDDIDDVIKELCD
jgi:hypothetical protein